MSKDKTILGKLLVEDGAITEEQLDKALEVQRTRGGLLGIILITLGYIDDRILVQYLYKQAMSLSGTERWIKK